MNIIVLSNLLKGFTADQEKILETASEEATQRDKDIKEIVKSITELAAVFKELSVLVIEQVTKS
jgi:t-SNARE complex subunit (syntaxin)